MLTTSAEELAQLHQSLALMGRLADSMLDRALEVLTSEGDRMLAEIEQREAELNARHRELDLLVLRFNAPRGATAPELRALFMSARIATELERIGDQAVNIAHNARRAGRRPPSTGFTDLRIMAEVVQGMLRTAVEALVHHDTGLACRVLAEEDKVDAFRDRLARDIPAIMSADPGAVPAALALLFISHYLERIGDHATNIAEAVLFLANGLALSDVGSAPPP